MFRTELPLIPAPHQLPLSARVLTIGSCFSDTIGSRLAETKVHTLVNPFGTLFNPVTACKLLRAAAGEEMDWQQHLVEARGRWQSYDFHANVGADSPVELLQTIQQTSRDTGVFLVTADVVVLTLGTAWAYRLKETDELVSNCHKVPAEKFNKELLTPDEIINAVAETHAYLRLRNPKLRFVLTVSPVRHLKDTLPLNAVSKSVLRVACHYLSELLPDVSYFPAYELLLDDLRDYRFYAADMLHPSVVAEDYIWERFARTYFDVEFGRFRKEWESVRQAIHHRPLYSGAPEHRQFLVNTLERLEKLSRQADMRMEILEIRKQIQNLPVPKPTPVPEPEPEDDEERIDIGDETPAIPLVPAEHTTLIEAISDAVEVETEETEEFSEAEAMAETMEEVPQPKKKRRNRGGAKRNKKKHAARLAEEAAALAAGTTILVSEATIVAESEIKVEELAAEETNTSSVVAVTLDPDAPLQTALERRKRASRRGRGRGKHLTEVVSEATGIPTDPSALAPDAVETPNVADATSESTTEAALPDSAPPITDQPSTVEPTTSVITSGLQRPVRTGRSASEVRAAALRKSRRPDSRIKTLYATPPETPPGPVSPIEATSAEAPISPDAAPALPVSTAAEASTQSQPIVSSTEPPVPVKPPVVDAIPPVKGTGASGRLSASGHATLNREPVSKNQTPPPPIAEVETPVEPTIASPAPEVAAPAETAPAPTQTNEEVAAAPIAEVAPAETSAEPVPAASAPKKSRRKPANSKAKQEDAPAEQSATAEVSPTASNKPAPKAKNKKGVAEKSASASPAPEDVPTQRRRKPAAKSVAAPETPAAAPKRPARTSRRKPATPDETPDAS
ncbi:GSCFA domain-containing protein [Hymenobacter sp. YC55]|uniref:GSCFA domain-containing protein n=1 Tax=Hymenobacter sp. YC55 TaxID=3034019 RepID=UPI0023F62E7C|nr:GSCFA domain-containing protein [Hymenobacter sp. YC55]MDF7813526.1 GSCFA domain-containing protein [Hymenobacter sp. YC55]